MTTGSTTVNGGDRAVIVSFCTLALARFWHVLNMREVPMQYLKNEITRNSWIWAAVGICVALIRMAVYTPLLRELVEPANPGAQGWLLIILASFVPVLVGPVVNHVAIRTGKEKSAK